MRTEQNLVTNSQLNTDDQLTLSDLFRKLSEWGKYLLSKWFIIACLGIIGGLIGFAFAFTKKPLYTATTSFVLEIGDGAAAGGLGQYSGLASMVGIDLGGGGSGIFQGENIIELYQSRRMIEKTLLSSVEVDQMPQTLINQYIVISGSRKRWQKNPALASLNFRIGDTTKFNRIQDSILREAVKDIRQHYLSVGKTDKKLNLIEVNVTSSNELFAKAFNDQIVANVNDFYIQTKTKKAIDNVKILQHKTDSIKRVLSGDISSAAFAADATPNLNPVRQAQRSVPIQKSQFSAETNKAVLSELLKNLELSKLSLLKETPLIQVVDAPIFPLEVTKTSTVTLAVLGFIMMSFLTIIFLLISYSIKIT